MTHAVHHRFGEGAPVYGQSLLSWGGIPTSSHLSLQLAAASASLCRVHSTMALRLRVAPAAWRSMRRITATDAHASRAHSPSALVSIPTVLTTITCRASGHMPATSESQKLFIASRTCPDVGRRRPASVGCPQSLVGGLATFAAGGAPLGEDEQGLVSDLGPGSLRVKVTLQLWNIA